MDANLENLKLHLNIYSGDTTDDVVINNYLDVATIAVNNYLDVAADISSGYTSNDLTIINSAIILLAAHYYNNRNMVSMGNTSDMPYTFKFLLNNYRNLTLQ